MQLEVLKMLIVKNVKLKVLPDCLTPIVSSGVGARPVTSLVISIS